METLADIHLTLRLTRLKPAVVWPNPAQGFSILLSKTGSGQVVGKSSNSKLHQGDVLVLNSISDAKIGALQKEFSFWSFSVCFEHFFPLLAVDEIGLLQNSLAELKCLKHYPESSAVAQECHRLAAAAPPCGDLNHRSQVLRIAAVILSAEFKYTRCHSVGFVRIEERLQRIFDELTTNDLLTLSVQEMAEKFHCSRRHLSRLFQQHFGYSVASLKMEMRLLKALSLLRNPEMKIIHVAESCGFNHLGLFNACFKKRFGSTPGRWRREKMPTDIPHAEGSATDLPASSEPMPSNGHHRYFSAASGPQNGIADAEGIMIRETAIRNLVKLREPFNGTPIADAKLSPSAR